MGELRDLFAALGVTVLAVTHDQAEAFGLAQRLVLLDGGRVLQAGTPAAVWAQPASVRAARLLGFTNVGPPPGDPTGAPVLIRPEGIRLDARAGVPGVVVAVTFQGARSRVRVALDGGGSVEAEVPSGEAPVVGAAVGLAIDPGAVVALAP